MTSYPTKYVKDEIKSKIIAAYESCVQAGELERTELLDFDIEITKDSANGDFSTNFAMKNARQLKKSPLMIGEAIVLRIDCGELIKNVCTAGPGFINFTLESEYYQAVVAVINEKGGDYGKIDILDGQKINVEFVSANPTGPMHMGNARGGVVGDCLASVLQWAGALVHREFYVNDAGNQVALFGLSLYTRLYQHIHGENSVEFPENGYHGEDIKELAVQYLDNCGKEVDLKDEEALTARLIRFGLEKNITKMKRDLDKYKIKYDRWFLESSLHEDGYVEETITLLEKSGAIYESEGAKWFKATEFGCEKDEVLVKANGFYTYYAVDIAYHRDKLERRSFDSAIDVLGADHHGHTLRFKAGLSAVGIEKERLSFVLMQLVRLMRDGNVVRMSKRTGKSITLNDLLDEIPVDAARFFFNMRQSDTTMDFDLALALKQDNENPVYYVQYAHARICSILRNLDEQEDGAVLVCSGYEFEQKEERELIKLLALLPYEIEMAATTLEPSRITRYVMNVAAAFHSFYNACRIKGERDNILRSRLALAYATKTVIKNALDLIGVSAPEKM